MGQITDKFTDEIPPTGFIFGLQEPNFNETTKKLGSAFKYSEVKYDRTASRPRAGIIASKNMNIELEPNYTDGDVCTCTWNSGTEFGLIYLVSLYGENNQKPRNENVVIPPTLIRLLKKCRRERNVPLNDVHEPDKEGALGSGQFLLGSCEPEWKE